MQLSGRSFFKACGRFLACAGLVSIPVLAQAASDEDPWEKVNRPIFKFNDAMDTYLLRPVAKGYDKVTPNFLQTGITNVFKNVGDVRNLVNNLLQIKFRDASVDTARLMINSTVGLLGFFDVATKAELDRNDEDFGQTLAVWGVPSGPYVMLPFFGPSTVRDATARIPDAFLGPYPYFDVVRARNLTFALDTVNNRANLIPMEKMVTGDKYTFIRNTYLQNREFKIKDGKVEDDF